MGELAGLASSASAFSEVTTDLATLQELHTFFGLHQASLDISQHAVLLLPDIPPSRDLLHLRLEVKLEVLRLVGVGEESVCLASPVINLLPEGVTLHLQGGRLVFELPRLLELGGELLLQVLDLPVGVNQLIRHVLRLQVLRFFTFLGCFLHFFLEVFNFPPELPAVHQLVLVLPLLVGDDGQQFRAGIGGDTDSVVRTVSRRVACWS